MNDSTRDTLIKLIASDRNWIEGEAVRQLHRTAELPGMRFVVGFPDLHPGKGHPVGAAFFSEGMIYPSLVGNDVGCGDGALAYRPQPTQDETRPLGRSALGAGDPLGGR
jgi:release factor H-coupled RctB family protein